MAKKEIKLIELNPKITINRKIIKFLFKTLGIKNPRCTYCRKKVTMANWGGLFRGKRGENLMLCMNECCMFEYLAAENPKIEEKEKKT